MTCSADKTVKLISMPSGDVLSTCTLGDKLGDFAVGCCWSGDTPLAVTLSGLIRVLSPDFSAVASTISGHQEPILSHSLSASGDLYTSSADGTVCRWAAGSRACERVGGGAGTDLNGAVHSGQASTVDAVAGGCVSTGERARASEANAKRRGSMMTYKTS
jgi:WD40 repeat protein